MLRLRADRTEKELGIITGFTLCFTVPELRLLDDKWTLGTVHHNARFALAEALAGFLDNH